MSKAKLLFNGEIQTIDLPEILIKLNNDQALFSKCLDQIELELTRICNNPTNFKLCEYEPLASAEYRKVKLFSNKNLQNKSGSKPDLRIIYKYDSNNNIVMIHSIGFRVKERPRPDDDPYSQAINRLLNL